MTGNSSTFKNSLGDSVSKPAGEAIGVGLANK